MAKSKHHSRPKMTIPLAVVAGVAPLVLGTIEHGTQVGWTGQGDTAADFLIRSLTGWSPTYGMKFTYYAKSGLLPIAVGVLAHKVAGILGVNRARARARVPLLRI